MARRVLSAEEALMEVVQWDLYESESGDDDELDLTMDESIFDDSDSGPMDTDVESSGSSDEDSDSPNDSGWSAWQSNDPDFPHRPFTVQNSGVHFPSQPESELALQHFLTDELLMELVMQLMHMQL